MQCFSPTAQSQECVVQNLPQFETQGGSNVARLRSGTQVIIPDYSFDCYMVMSLSEELLWSVLEVILDTLLTFKSGGAEEDKEQLGTVTLLVITVSHQLIHLLEVKLTYICASGRSD